MQLTCSVCRLTKDEADFHRNSGKAVGRHSACKPCANAARKASRLENGRPPNKRAYNLSTRYRMTVEDEARMLADQQGCCAICRATLSRHHIDHNHTTGAVRGLLCARCNLGVGHIERPGFLDAAIDYLKKNGGGQ